ncbi:MAG: hypothetical protein A2V70_08030 [Planctomycetes bacterium RBG_13_63_9]|nr:MAG: hypothetical protein A2V70_08030 [Planctomycetes bacterium RBG_13_63_9]
MDEIAACRRPRRAFTLIEMLVVVVIIGILAGLVTAAAIAARNRAKIAVIQVEVSQLDMAIKEYKNKFGDYPPDFYGVHEDYPPAIRDAARTAVLRHLTKAFPRCTISGADVDEKWDTLRTAVMSACGLSIDNLTPASAMVFWLGGLPASGAATKLVGFSANPRNPFDTSASRLPKLFEFEETRIQGFDASGACVAWPTFVADGQKTPYVYFRARKTIGDRWEYGVVRGGTNFVPFDCDPTDNTNISRPYLESVVGTGDPLQLAANSNTVRRWMNLETFQIISPGLDDRFGCDHVSPFKFAPTGLGFCDEGNDFDNITNFSKGTLEDGME